MGKPGVVFHVLIENGYEAGLIEQTLRNADDDASFVRATKDSLHISQHDVHILLLEPSMSRWEWLDVLIKMTREHPDLPVILYSRDINVENDFHSLPGEAPVFLASDVNALKDNLEGIIRKMKEKDDPKKSILFVDDDENVLKSYARVLRKSPWKILTASNAENALEILRRESISLVVTDMKMPEVHGIELISRIRENFDKLPIIVCSAYPGMKDDDNLKFHDIAGFVEKPVDPDLLEAKLKELL
jgi:DNA-binding NtrC family response regulator